MPWLDPRRFELIDEHAEFPWAVIGPLRWMDPETGEIHAIPDGFRTDGSSFPKLMMAIPFIGAFLSMRHFGNGMWLGFAGGTLHDYLRRSDENDNTPVPPDVAHLKFKRALIEDGFSEDVVENYYAAVVKFNS
jgi:hypothetical protein